ncbi:MAG: hypothetical protein AB1656_12955 [Candidatus Omnitrophota bacterium]
MSKKKKILFILIASFLSGMLSFVFCEIVFRLLLFGNVSFMQKFRDPKLYGDWASDADDDCWLLGHRFEKFPPPQKTHPILGWSRNLAHDSYLHRFAAEAGTRQSVLLYGDSFAKCEGLPEEKCFEGILNQDEEFSRDHFLLNYGAGGYGMDQIYLLFKNSIDLYENPFVVMSLMTLDMDRVVLSVRGGQKPYLELIDGGLELRGVPIDPDSEHFFRTRKPRIPSYLWRLFLHGNVLPQKWHDSLIGTKEKQEKKIAINRKILEEIHNKLEDKKIPYVFAVFHPYWAIEQGDNWRDDFLRNFLEENRIPYIWAKDIISNDIQTNHKKLDEYFLQGGGHPNSYQYQIVAKEIKKYVLQPNAF